MTDLHVLMMQNRLCSRSAKEAATLLAHGARVSLIELAGGSTIMDPARFVRHEVLPYQADIVSVLRHRRRLVADLDRLIDDIRPDVVHTQNGPDCFGAWLSSATNVPLVHDFHDLQTTTPTKWPETARFHRAKGHWVDHLQRRWERRVAKRAAAVLTTSPRMAEHMRRRHGARRVFSLENKPARTDVRPKPRLSARDGKRHLVYAGGITPTPGGQRDLVPVFERFAADGIDVHVYLVSYNEDHRAAVADRVAAEPRIHLHPVVPQERFIDEMSQYDLGLIWFTDIDENVRLTTQNKLYEFQVAGLPIITNLTEGFTADYIRRRGCGITITDPGDVRARMPELEAIRPDPTDCFMEPKDLLAVYSAALGDDPR